ncbi:MAG: spermidine synthase-like protein [Desulfobulbales bacterium]
MNDRETPTLRLHLSLALLSAALIGFQLEQMQLLAILQWHHFAYLIISVALLGFGASGTCIALLQVPLLRNLNFLLPFCMFCCAIMMAVALPLSQSILHEFDISLLFIKFDQTGLLLMGQLIYLLVFFLGALPLGLIFIRYSSRIGSLYCANLVGSGIGAISVVALMYFLLPEQMPGLTALLPWIAGILVTPWGRFRLLVAGAMSLQLIAAVIYYTPFLHSSQYKAINRTLLLPGAGIIANAPSPYGLVQLVTAPTLRYAPGLSLSYDDEVQEVVAAVFNNGDWFGAVKVEDRSLLDATAAALPYALARRNNVLILEARTGSDIVQALQKNAEKVMAVEPHRKAVEVAIEGYEINNSHPFADPRVELAFLTSRTWLALDHARYDLITLPTVGSFGGSSGLFALQEQYLLTKEAFLEIWHHLSQDGVLRISAWLDSPPRNSLRLAATIAETLNEAGVDFSSHVTAVRGWDMITFMVKRSPFSQKEIQQIRTICNNLQFDPVFLPELDQEERQQYHFSPDSYFLDHLKSIVSSHKRQEFYDEYDFNLQPVTDNRPFFSQFLRWQSIPHLIRLFGERTTPFLELGYVLVLISFSQMVLAAGVLILLPLFRLGLPGRKKVQGWTIPFFSGLGLGYMFFEIVMIHELVLFFGHPIYAAAAVISGLLIFSGLGSLSSYRLSAKRSSHARAAFLVSLLLLLYFFILQPILNKSIGLPLIWKTIIFLLLISPLSFAMGMPFPLGLARLAGHSKSQAAWAWGINGSASVVSTGLAAIIAVELGFSAVMLIACGAYGLAALTGFRR